MVSGSRSNSCKVKIKLNTPQHGVRLRVHERLSSCLSPHLHPGFCISSGRALVSPWCRTFASTIVPCDSLYSFRPVARDKRGVNAAKSAWGHKTFAFLVYRFLLTAGANGGLAIRPRMGWGSATHA